MTLHSHTNTMADIHALKQKFSDLIGSENVITDRDEVLNLGKDWTSVKPDPLIGLLPRSVAHVQAILAYCNDHRLAVVPSGGRTGLCAGAVATQKEIVLSTAKMNKILNIDPIGATMQVEAGAITQTIQKAALDAGFFYGVDLAAKGSCQLGGNIATNAGGLKLIRYGGTREQVLGLEAVLASGQVLDMDHALVKNNTGYDLKHLFIGSEGTLGVVTKATLKLMPIPRDLQIIGLCVDSFQKVTEVLGLCHKEGIRPTAFEFLTDAALNLVLATHPNIRNPFNSTSPFYVLLETEKGPKGSPDLLEGFIETAFNNDLITDGVLASSSAEFANLWAVRENISESVSVSGWVRKNDIALAIKDLAPFLNDMEKELRKIPPYIQMILFGHIGDGNLHLNYLGDKTKADFETFSKDARQVETKVFELLKYYKGSISAEHGIGLTKKRDLLFSRNPLEVAFMKEIKRVFDPNNILNPGKIFDLG